MQLSEAEERFAEVYARRPCGAARAPGRVNLIGEHTDYNDGFVLPIAVEKTTHALFAPREDSTIRLASQQAESPASIDLTRPIRPGKPPWANYVRGVAAGLVGRGVELAGADLLFVSDIPLGGGLSSSAALEVAAALGLLAVSGKSDALPARELALLCQRAEHEFAGAPCGIMDQSIATQARRGMALLLDCRSGEGEHIPFDTPETVLLIVDTQVHHDLAAGEYARRRQQCFDAARRLGVPSLRDLDEQDTANAEAAHALDRVQACRVRHVVREIARTLAAADALRDGRMRQFGQLMFESHASLRDDFQVSCEELDVLVEAARGLEGVYGARMTGGGFGGCAIILVAADRAGPIIEAIRRQFAERFGRTCPIFASRAVEGASLVQTGSA